LQPKVEPEKFGLKPQPGKEEKLVEQEEDIFEITFKKEEVSAEIEDDEDDLEFEVRNEPAKIQEKVVVKSTPFLDRLKGNTSKKQKQQKQPKPIPEASVDNWFFKNFGLNKIFEDDVEDDAL
jgi:cell division protein FtsZ